MTLLLNKLYKIIFEWLSVNGDHSFWGWFITLFYLITIVTSFYFLKNLQSKAEKEKKNLITSLTIFLTFMGINKQLDLQLLLSILGRRLAEKYDFLKIRRVIQFYFEFTLFLIVFTIGFVIIYKTRNTLKNFLIELIGITILIVFFFLQSASMLHFKMFIKFDEINIPHIHALEFLGILIILSGLFYNIKKNQRQKYKID